jgi:hypothetical protein
MNTTCSQAKSQLSKKAEIQSFFQGGRGTAESS